MDKAAMVSIDISTGAELIDVLERAKIKVSVALWTLLSEYGDWRMIVAARQFDSPDPTEAYRLVNKSLDAEGFTLRNRPPLLILSTMDPFIRELHRLFGKSWGVEGMRLGGQLIGDRFVEDAYVYRIG